MDAKKIIIICMIMLIIIAISTAAIINMKPQMHKTFQLENLIFKRGNK